MTSIKRLKQKLLFHSKLFFIAFYYAARHPRRFWNALSSRGKTWVMRGLIAALIVLIAVPASFWYQASRAKAAWWNEDWAYRQKIQLTNSTGSDLEDFQVSTTVDTASLIAAGKMQATTCADMRFTDSKGKPLPYWIEENNPGCGNAATKVWVKAPKVYNGTNATSIYMYYGNPSASATQSGDKTFEFFDDFNGSQIDNEKWTQFTGTGNIQQTGGGAQFSCSGSCNWWPPSTNDSPRIYHQLDSSSNFVMQAKMNGYTDFPTNSYGGLMVADTPAASGSNLHTICRGKTGLNYFMYQQWDGTNNYTASNANPAYLRIIKASSNYYFDFSSNGSSWTNQQTSSLGISPLYAVIFAKSWAGNAVSVSFDYIFSRKYASADPSTSASAEEIGPGPVAYWKFDEGQGLTTQDATVNGNDGTLVSSPTWRSEDDCVVGKCLEFNGSSSYVSAIHSSGLPIFSQSGYSVSIWVKGLPNQNDKRFFSEGSSTNGNPLFNLGTNLSSDKLDVYIRDDNGSARLAHAQSTTSVFDNSWHHIVWIDNNGTAKVYIDGKQDATDFNYTAPTTFTFDRTSIGAILRASPGNYFQGLVDEVKLYPYVRSAAQIQQDYNAGQAGMGSATSAALGGESPKWMTDGLVGHWKMDETSGTNVADASGNANTGTLTNAQETGTAQSGSNTTTILDGANGALSTTDDAYNGMIIQITSGGMNGTQRTITDYTGSTKTFAFAALSGDPTGVTYIILHQTGGKFGNGLGFGGDNDYGRVSNNAVLHPTGAVTVSAWVKPFGKSGYQGIVGAGSTNSYQLFLYGSSNVVRWDTTNVGGRYMYNPGVTVSSGAWSLLTASYEASTGMLKVYVNGDLKASQVHQYGAGNIATSNSDILLGYSNITTEYFQGLLDDVRIYNRALTPSEVEGLSQWGPGPVGWWKMDENVSGDARTIADSSGYGNNGTTNDGANNTGMDCTKQGKYGGGCNLDGTDDRIRVTDPGAGSVLDMHNGLTLSAWIYPTDKDAAGVYQGVIDKLSDTAGYRLLVRQGYVYLGIRGEEGGSGAYDGTSSASTLPANNQWYHIEGVVSGSNMYIYINGVLNKSYTTTKKVAHDNQYLYFGYSIANTQYFNGLVDDIRIYNYARSAKQVVEDMNAGHPIGGSPVGSPVAYWKMDEGQGDTAYDSSINHNDGTLNSGESGDNDTNAKMWDNNGKFGKAMEFDGSNDSVAVDDSASLSITQSISISTWIKVNALPSDGGAYPGLVCKGDYTTGFCLDIGSNAGGKNFRFYTDSGMSWVSGEGNLQTGTWYHVTGVYDHNTGKRRIYVNGVQKDEDSYSGGITDGNQQIKIGSDSGNHYFDGLIDEVKVYNSALTPNQIALDMNQGKSVQFGGQTSVGGATGAAAEYCVPGDTTSCAGPIGEWKFDEKTGGSVNDTSGNGNLGTWYGTGTHWTRGKYGSAGNFNGSDDYITGPVNNFPTSGTIELWFKLASPLDAVNDALFVYGNGWYTNDMVALRVSSSTDDKLRFIIYASSAETVNIASDTAILGDIWYHAVATYQNNEAKLFINGKQQGSTDTSCTMPSNAGTLYYISKPMGYGEYMRGLIDDARVFNYVRTPAQVAWDYNRGKPVGWWKMDEGEGGYAYDSSGNANTGTLTNMDPPTDWVDGKFGKALEFGGAGSSNSVNISDSSNSALDITKELTMSAWIKTSSTAAQAIVRKDNAYQLFIDNATACGGTNGAIAVLIGNGSTWACSSIYYVSGSTSVADGNWHHVVGEYKDATNSISIYVDGKLYASSSSATVALGANNNSLYIGRNVAGGISPFAGPLDDIRLYNYVLTAEQMKQVRNEGSVVRFGE